MPVVSSSELSQRRQEILDGARRCFAEHGYEGATVRRLEETIGKSRGAIFHHFGDKENLFLALAREDAARMAEVVAANGLVEVMRDMLKHPERHDWLATRLEITKMLRTDPTFRMRWQEHQKNSIHIERSQADALWKRFSAARSSFNSARRSWMQQRDTVRAAAKEQKEKIIAKAEELKNSTDWAGTSRQFNNLMDQWKAAGRVGRRSEDDALWKRFREAADTFFDARQADRNKTNEDEAENLKKKEELLVKAQALVPVNTAEQAKQARQALARIQDDWDSIGHVPRTDVHRIESALDEVEKQIKAAEDAQWAQSDPETDARKSDFEVQLNAQLADLDRKIAAEADPAKKKDLESEKAAKEAWLKAIS